MAPQGNHGYLATACSVERTYVKRPAQSEGRSPANGTRPPASLSRVYSQFTGIVLSWMAVLVIAWDF